MFVNQKSQEISYALVRVTPYIRRFELRSRIEKLAFRLLEESGAGDLESAIKTCIALEGLVSLGKSIYEVEPVNANIIIGELKALESSMRQIVGLEADGDLLPDMGSFFSKVPAVIPSNKELGNAANNPASQLEDAAIGGSNGMASTIRQSAILEKIRQSESRQVQLKDILASFPEVSERTMRYDLQKLCSQGLIERVGNGGPSSYYALKS